MKTNGAKKQMLALIVSNYEPQHNEMETHTPFILIPADVFHKVNVMFFTYQKNSIFWEQRRRVLYLRKWHQWFGGVSERCYWTLVETCTEFQNKWNLDENYKVSFTGKIEDTNSYSLFFTSQYHAG